MSLRRIMVVDSRARQVPGFQRGTPAFKLNSRRARSGNLNELENRLPLKEVACRLG